MELLLAGFALAGLASAAAAAAVLRWFRGIHATPSSGLFGTKPEHLNVRSADNVRLLSDEQLRALEETVDEAD